MSNKISIRNCGQYIVQFNKKHKNVLWIKDTKNNKTIYIDDSTLEQLIFIHKNNVINANDDGLIYACEQGTQKVRT
tara:strand:- start:873 stop:1100 length:228 start_codon:yes stop_codon:yes gene_type:complete